MVKSGNIGAGSRDNSHSGHSAEGVVSGSSDNPPQANPASAAAGPGLSSKAILAIVLVAVALTAVAVYLYVQPSGAAATITSPGQAANTSLEVAKTAADLGSSLDGIQEKLSPS